MSVVVEPRQGFAWRYVTPVKKTFEQEQDARDGRVLFLCLWEGKHGFESQSAMRRWWFHDVFQIGVANHD